MAKKSRKNTDEQAITDEITESNDIQNEVQTEKDIEEITVVVDSEQKKEEVIKPIIDLEDNIKEVKVVSKYPNIDDSFSQYLNAIRSSNFAMAIKSLSSLFHNLAVKGDEKQLEYTLNLFKNNKKEIFDFKTALNGISDLNKTIRLNTEIMFVVFNKIINNTPNNINYDMIRSKTKNEKLIMWIQRKIKK